MASMVMQAHTSLRNTLWYSVVLQPSTRVYYYTAYFTAHFTAGA